MYKIGITKTLQTPNEAKIAINTFKTSISGISLPLLVFHSSEEKYKSTSYFTFPSSNTRHVEYIFASTPLTNVSCSYKLHTRMVS